MPKHGSIRKVHACVCACARARCYVLVCLLFEDIVSGAQILHKKGLTDIQRLFFPLTKAVRPSAEHSHSLFYCAMWRLKVPQGTISAKLLQALVYDILPSTTAVFSYAIGSRKLLANDQFLLLLLLALKL